MLPVKSITSAEKFVEHALEIGALEIIPKGRVLKSGRISPYFFNSGLFYLGGSLGVLAQAYASPIDQMIWSGSLPKDVVIFGPAYKGTFLAPAIALQLAWKYNRDIGYSSNRKEAKDHGEKGIVLGSPLQGKKVLIADDVMTTGTSCSDAVDIVRTNGGTPIGVMIAFDRQERGNASELSAVQEFQQDFDIPVTPAATLDDLVSVLNKKRQEDGADYGEDLDAILTYRQQYGVS